MKKIENKVMLITYADSMGGDIKQLDAILDKYFPGMFGGVHVLPFFPSSGDRGFAVIHYNEVDPAFGTWEDIDRLAEKYYLMADFMLNHVSIRCEEFRDYMEHGDASPYRDMFIHWNEFWPGGEPTAEELDALYRRKNQGPYFEFTRKDGKAVRLWNTFFEEQADIDPYAPATRDYYRRNLTKLADHVPLVRFDAFAYASKVPGTSCFFVEPQIWDVLEAAMEPLRERGTEMLPEIHENYTIQMKIADKGYWVYDFALPALMLHTLFTGDAGPLHHWLEICPRKQFTTLDTHDGIGMVDVQGLLTEEQIDALTRKVDGYTADVKALLKMPSIIRVPGKKVMRYQLITSYYSALNCDDHAYLLARAMQYFTPGIPQVYYVGMLAGRNDIDGLKRNGEPRSVNRHNYTEEEIAQALDRKIVRDLNEITRFRNSCDAFNGDVAIAPLTGPGRIRVTWTKGSHSTTLDANFLSREFTITERRNSTETLIFEQKKL